MGPKLLEDMLWYVDAILDRRACSETYLAPSWSWASNAQPISCLVSPHLEVSRVAIIKTGVEYASKLGTYGLVTSGYITLSGHATQGYWAPEDPLSTFNVMSDGKVPSSQFTLEIHSDAKEDISVDSEPVFLVVLLSDEELSTAAGLVLRKYPDGKYSRLGMFYIGFISDPTPSISGLIEGNQEDITIV
ncbi:hypothetical protein DL95DRAFT_417748 [Leptodontidium sp. 2 PMI_412]|nr:hypothetical protein DL95DRAFT_417748 [Leptodontidium sp. 2 PMI_412]